jgi:hypothetical protein
MIMENDPLAAFRKKPLTASEPPVKIKEKEGYVAFDAKDNPTRLRIRRAAGSTRSPGYAYLLDVAYDGDHGTNIVLSYTFLMVIVQGRNLQNIIFALETGSADFIQEFDPSLWEKPTDKTAPFIESIEVIVQASGASIAGAEQGGETRH